jgi:hypothetical protein
MPGSVIFQGGFLTDDGMSVVTAYNDEISTIDTPFEIGSWG